MPVHLLLHFSIRHFTINAVLLFDTTISKGWRGTVVHASDSFSMDACQAWVHTPSKATNLFPWARNFTLIAQYWLVPGTDLCEIYISRAALFRTIELK